MSFEDKDIKGIHHKRTPDGGALCGAAMIGIITLWEEDGMVNCEKCIEKRQEQENNEDDV